MNKTTIHIERIQDGSVWYAVVNGKKNYGGTVDKNGGLPLKIEIESESELDIIITNPSENEFFKQKS